MSREHGTCPGEVLEGSEELDSVLDWPQLSSQRVLKPQFLFFKIQEWDSMRILHNYKLMHEHY